jgi:hypothetical protein
MKRQLRLGLLFIGVVLLLLPAWALAQRQNAPAEETPSPAARGVYERPAYFPLSVGNEWIYSNGTDRLTVRVLRETIEANGLKYFEISGYWPNDPAKVRKIRRALPDLIYEFNPSGKDFLWYQFGGLGATWRIGSGEEIPCVTGSGAVVADINAKVEVPAGKFNRVMRIDFTSRCMDAGIGSEYFAGGVGLIQRVLNTLAGPRTINLIAAHINSSDFPPPYGIGISLDRPLYYNNLMPPVVDPWPTARVRLTVRNETEWPVRFAFPTSQRFDFIVRDSSGKELMRWSDGRLFLMVMGEEIFLKESRSYSADLVLRTRDGRPLPAGFYTVTGYLTTRGADSDSATMAAIARFEIQDIH